MELPGRLMVSGSLFPCWYRRKRRIRLHRDRLQPLFCGARRRWVSQADYHRDVPLHGLSAVVGERSVARVLWESKRALGARIRQLGDLQSFDRYRRGVALTDRSGPDSAPVESPDGKKIAYLGYEDKVRTYQVTNLHVMNADGSGKRWPLFPVR